MRATDDDDLTELAEARKALDGNFEVDDPPAASIRVPSTPETRDRYAFLKAKKAGSVWEEDGRLYRMGSGGVTVFKLWCFG